MRTVEIVASDIALPLHKYEKNCGDRVEQNKVNHTRKHLKGRTSSFCGDDLVHFLQVDEIDARGDQSDDGAYSDLDLEGMDNNTEKDDYGTYDVKNPSSKAVLSHFKWAFAEYYPSVEQRNTLVPAALEYFNSLDVQQFVDECAKVSDKLHDELITGIVLVIEAALASKSNGDRENACKLLVDLVNDHDVQQSQVELAFIALLSCIEDLMVDIPLADKTLSKFISRAIYDETIRPHFLKETEKHPSELVFDIIDNASGIYHTRHHSVVVQHVFGACGSLRETSESMYDAVLEYIDSNSIEEMELQIHDWNMPHYMHELVYMAVTTVLERHKADITEKIQSLFQTLEKEGHLPNEQVSIGFSRIQADMEDISIDCPTAPTNFESFKKDAADKYHYFS